MIPPKEQNKVPVTDPKEMESPNCLANNSK
jgi:hypothetical protein